MYHRYAIYYTAQGALGRRGAAWLGWDVAAGRPVEHPVMEGLDVAALTKGPRVYGFHSTLMAPFRPAPGVTEEDLLRALHDLARDLHPACVTRLEIAALGRFIALVPQGDQSAVRAFASQVVRRLDPLRAPLTPDDLARRRKAHLSPQQEANLMRWGYPHVMDQFRFHMTLTGRMEKTELASVQSRLDAHFRAVLPHPFCVDALTLVGQRRGGHFETLDRVAVQGDHSNV